MALPWAWGVGDILVSALRLYRAFPQEKRRVAATLSARSMIEAHGRSAHGGLLFRPEGPGDTVQQHHGGPSQPAHRGLSPGPGELTAAIENPPEPVRPELEGCLRFPDGSVYRFTGTDLTVDGEPGWYQLMAQNVTEQVEINRQLARQNEKLKKTNGRLQKMYDRIADDIREKESLKFKIYIHDTMGRSLLTIQNIMNSGEETAQKLRSLEEAVAVLSSQTGLRRRLWYKDHGTDAILDVIRRTVAGEHIFPDFSPSVEMKKCMSQDFSPAQIEILRAFIKGYTYREIAEKFNLSVSGVRYNIAEMVRIGGVKNKEELTTTAIENKLVITTLEDGEEER